jgi:hypothetical protein
LIRDLFYVSPANKLFNLEDQFNRALSDIKLEALSVLHTRVRLKSCALNHYLYLKMNCYRILPHLPAVRLFIEQPPRFK